MAPRSISFSLSTFTVILFMLLIYGYVGYQLDRTDVAVLLANWMLAFAGSWILIRKLKLSFRTLAGIALLFRILFIFSIPTLSQDFYRFIWDGRMTWEGLNPLLSTPEQWMRKQEFPIPEAAALYQGMGELNGSHYTNYPPISQFVYMLAAAFGSNSILTSVIVIRIVLILADIGTWWLGSKLLSKLEYDKSRIYWFVLNPFVIIELVGNLHFEGLMVFFIVASLYFLYKNRTIVSGSLLAGAVLTKLIPLLFLPLYLPWFLRESNKEGYQWRMSGLKAYVIFCSCVIGTVIIGFIPFASEQWLENFWASIALWFQNFEFNASIYYIFRWIGYQIYGWNQIALIGKILPVLTVLILLYLSFRRKQNTFLTLIQALLFGITSYYFLSTTVHPWYVAVPLILSIFTPFRYALVWSLVVIFSYTAYIHEVYKEDLRWVALEYIIVYGVFMYELVRYKRKKPGTESVSSQPGLL